MTEVLSRCGVQARFIPLDQVSQLPQIVGERSRVFWFETPANPINRLVDLEQAAEASRKAGILSIVDNTFATPALQQPLKHGIDAVMHSATKYLGGHSDLTAGALAGSKEFVDRVRRMSVAVGTTLDPAAAYLLARGIKTLDVRVRASCDNAPTVAQTLCQHPKVSPALYPRPEEDPDN